MFAITRKVDELIQIGGDMVVGPTDIDAKIVRLLARGRIIGGPDDGASFTKTAELGINGEMRLGEHVIVSVVDIRGDAVRLGIQVPKHVEVSRKENARQDRGEA